MSSRLTQLHRKGGGRTVRASGDEGHQGNEAFQSQQRKCTKELTWGCGSIYIAFAVQRPSHIQINWDPSTEKGSRHKPPSLIQKLSPGVNHSENKNQFPPVSLDIQTTLKSPMTSSRWSTQNEPGDFWEMFLSQNVLCGHVFNLTEVLCMYGGFWVFLMGIFFVCVLVSICFLHFFFCCFVFCFIHCSLFIFNLSYVVIIF